MYDEARVTRTTPAAWPAGVGTRQASDAIEWE